jgi:hypothetical protein
MTVVLAPVPALVAVDGEPVVLVAGEDAPAVAGAPVLGVVELGEVAVPLPAALVELRSVLREEVDAAVLSLAQLDPVTIDSRQTIGIKR